MGSHSSKDGPAGGSAARFATTQWTMILKAGQRRSPDANRALESLCRAYWYPLYAYARRRGYAAEEAQDLTQGFFARLLEKDLLRTVDRQRGRFRSYLLTLFQRFLADEYQRAQSKKRGGGRRRLSIDFDTAEQRYRFEPVDDWTPERIFQRRWALTVLERVLAKLEHEYRAKGQQRLFHRCRESLTGSSRGPGYEQTAAELGMSPGAVRVAVHRMRRRYRALLKTEVAHTVDDVDAVEDELNSLRSALQGESF